MVRIKPRERNAIVQSLLAGVVPRVGLQHIQVGRKDEISAIITDLDYIVDGGATIRFIIGRYGSGKSFFLNLSRLVALEKKFVTGQHPPSPILTECQSSTPFFLKQPHTTVRSLYYER
jgi:hypothetical protein